jgi:hypothetical protein
VDSKPRKDCTHCGATSVACEAAQHAAEVKERINGVDVYLIVLARRRARCCTNCQHIA